MLNNRQYYTGGVFPTVVNSLGSFYNGCIHCRENSCIQIPVEPWEITAGDLYPDLMPFFEQVAGGPETDIVFVNFIGLDS